MSRRRPTPRRLPSPQQPPQAPDPRTVAAFERIKRGVRTATLSDWLRRVRAPRRRPLLVHLSMAQAVVKAPPVGARDASTRSAAAAIAVERVLVLWRRPAGFDRPLVDLIDGPDASDTPSWTAYTESN